MCAGTALDLFIHQPRQNPMVPAAAWLAAPPTVRPSTPIAAAADVHAAPPRAAPPSLSARARLGDVAPVLRAPRRARAEHRRRLLEHAVGGLLRRHRRALVRGRVGRSQSRAVAGLAARDVRLRDGPPADPSGAPQGPEGVRREPRAQSLPAAGNRAPAGEPDGNAYVYRVDGAARVRFVRAARREDRPRGRGAASSPRLRSRSRDPVVRRARAGWPTSQAAGRGPRARAGPSSRARTPARS